MKKPSHQILITRFLWIISGFLALGTFLDAVANAISLITLPIALFGTALIVVSLFSVQFYLSRNPLSWVANGSSVKISKLNLGLVLPCLGMLVLLWIPPIFNDGSKSQSTQLSVPCVNGSGSGGWMYEDLPTHYFPLGLITVNEWPLRSIPDHPMYDTNASWSTYGTCIIIPAKYP
ncbi:MAG: hypothetical protein AAF215_10885 [Cyanobacteria bacterium P01_A01_bin.123]